MSTSVDLWNYFPRPDPDSTIPSAGIERLLFDDATGSLQYVETAAEGLDSPQYLGLHPNLPVLYATDFTRAGRLISFDIRPDGRLTRQSSVDSLGALAIALTVHPAGTSAYVGNLGDGVLTACPLDFNGAVLGAELITPRPGEGSEHRSAPSPYLGGCLDAYCAMEGSKLHQVRVTPNGHWLLVTDVGYDEVTTYAVQASGMLSPQPITRVGFPSGSSPRHLEFHPSGKIVYVVGEHNSMLYVLEAQDFVPQRIIDSHPVAPPDYQGASAPSELQLHPDWRTLFVGVRRSDSITAFSVDESGGLTTHYHEPSLGRGPRAVKCDPVGRHLLVGNWHSNDLAVFAIGDDRRLRPVGEPVEVHSPSSIVFVPASIGSR
jgi:6-phosphogluconolactonase